METSTEVSLFELQIDHIATTHLKEAAKWAKFLAILGFIFCGIILLVAIFFGAIIGHFANMMGNNEQVTAMTMMGGGFISFIYIVFDILCFFPTLFIFRFASKMQKALRNNEQTLLNDSFRNLKACYRFMGILAIIYLGFIALILIIAIIQGATH